MRRFNNGRSIPLLCNLRTAAMCCYIWRVVFVGLVKCCNSAVPLFIYYDSCNLNVIGLTFTFNSSRDIVISFTSHFSRVLRCKCNVM